ncbi:MAG: peptidyl-prolyl cis-trans isomerase [bacterium]
MVAWRPKWAAVAVVLLAAAAGCRKGEEGKAAREIVVARAGDREIKAADVYRGLYPQGRPEDAEVDADASRRVVEQLLERSMILAWAEDNGVDVTDADVEGRLGLVKADYGARGFASYLKSQNLTPEAFEEIVRDDLAVEAAIEVAIVEKVSVSYDDVVAYYNVHAADFEVPAEFHVKQILTDDKARAEEALTKLAYGATFEEVARELSISPDRHAGGDVGYTALEALPPEVAAAVENLPPGQTSGVITTPYGFEVVKVVGVREARRRPLTEVRPEVEDLLRTEREEELYARWLEELKESTKVSVDDKALAEL